MMHRMKWLTFVFAGLVCAAVLGLVAAQGAEGQPAAGSPELHPLPVGAPAPTPLLMKTNEGQPFDLHAAIMAKPTVLMFVRGWW